MPRRPRMYLPEIPAHVVQRGNNRQACFFDDVDRQFYLICLERALRRYRVRLHAYVLMTNHVHLLMTPSDEHGISKLMSLVGKDYVMYVNRVRRRSGTLWEGRHKSSLVSAEEYLLNCYRYIELNPVRAGIAKSPGDFPWSSYACHALGRPDRLVQDHSLYMALGRTAVERRQAYREFLGNTSYDREIDAIRAASSRNFPLGDDRFQLQIQATLNRDIGHPSRGRPLERATGQK